MFEPEVHEQHAYAESFRVAKFDLFNEIFDYYLDGICTFEQARAQFKCDIGRMILDRGYTDDNIILGDQ